MFFLTLTIGQKQMTAAQANHFITTDDRDLNRFFACLNKRLDGGYAKVSVKESTESGYLAVHVLLYLETPLNIKWHEKSHTYRPDATDNYTRSILGSLRDLSNWNSVSPMWRVGFIDIYRFTNERLGFKEYANPINHIAKCITKSLSVESIPKLKTCKKISEPPAKCRTSI